MDKQELFKKLVKAMDNYNNALKIGVEDFENYYDSITEELYQEVKKRGFVDEFNDYALT